MLTAIADESTAVPHAADAPARDYARIARAIDYLRHHANRQPDLAGVARHLHLSEFHFQRLFTRWAGVSPKRFLQYLTVEHARTLLRSSSSVLDAAGETGLSGPGRLHDLFVTLEAVTPGEARSGGAGVEIRHGLHDTPFGPALVAVTQRGLCCLQFAENGRAALERLRHNWPRATLQADHARTATFAACIFKPLAAPPARPLALLVKGTNFQLKVWRALLALPAGTVTSYGRIAQQIGEAAAARAVGNAVGANPIAYLIPCHRVLRESGELGGYRWGETRKAAMLGWEAARAIVRPVISDS